MKNEEMSVEGVEKILQDYFCNGEEMRYTTIDYNDVAKELAEQIVSKYKTKEVPKEVLESITGLYNVWQFLNDKEKEALETLIAYIKKER